MAAAIGKVTSKGLSETIGEELVSLIANGVLKPGQRLNEVHLAESFGVSRGPLREAARELEGQGLVISRPRQGFYVADFTPRQIVDLYEMKGWIDQAIIHDVMTYLDRVTCLEILSDIESIVTSDKVSFANSLFAFRQRFVARLHNRILAAQALSMYRQLHIVTALIDVSDSEDRIARIARIVQTLRDFWQALAEGNSAHAWQVMQDDAAFWRKNVAPHFETNPTDITQK